MGRALANPTEVTPGIAATLSGDRLLHSRGFFFLRDQGLGNNHPERLQAIGLREAHLHAAHRLKCSNHQTRRDQEYKRERYLNHHKRISCAMAIPAKAHRACAAPNRE